jgi:Anti-sigma-K factor rskA/Putative zinc-finger
MTAGPHALTGAYAVHALPGPERLAFERHLEACPDCAREVRELAATAARLGGAAAEPPPAALWQRVRAEAGRTRQLPPVAGRVGRPERGGWPAGWRGGRRFPPLPAAAAALLVAAVSAAALGLGPADRVGRSERPADLVAAVLGAPDARRVVAALPGGRGQTAVVVSRQRGRAVFEAAGLRPAPAGRTYQLWVVDRSGPRPAGLVEAGAGGRVARLLDGRVAGSERVAMTIERRGGATQPTSEPLVVVDLRA